MTISLRRISILGRFPFIRLLQVIDNPAYLLHIIKKNLIYKRLPVDYAPRYAGMRFLSGQETLAELVSSGRSLARFSDGELEMLCGAGIYPPDSNWCQRWSPGIQRDLGAALASTDPRLLVAVDPPSTFLAPKNSVHRIRFEYNMWIDMRRIMWRYLQPHGTYGHSHLFIANNCPDLDWTMLRDHFRKHDIIVATGNTARIKHLNLGRRTFFVECGTENAYERKEQLKQQIRDVITREGLDKKATLVCACLGPTACIIAREFLAEDIRIWDTGHIFEFAARNFIETVFSDKEPVT